MRASALRVIPHFIFAVSECCRYKVEIVISWSRRIYGDIDIPPAVSPQKSSLNTETNFGPEQDRGEFEHDVEATLNQVSVESLTATPVVHNPSSLSGVCSSREKRGDSPTATLLAESLPMHLSQVFSSLQSGLGLGSGLPPAPTAFPYSGVIVRRGTSSRTTCPVFEGTDKSGWQMVLAARSAAGYLSDDYAKGFLRALSDAFLFLACLLWKGAVSPGLSQRFELALPLALCSFWCSRLGVLDVSSPLGQRKSNIYTMETPEASVMRLRHWALGSNGAHINLWRTWLLKFTRVALAKLRPPLYGSISGACHEDSDPIYMLSSSTPDPAVVQELGGTKKNRDFSITYARRRKSKRPTIIVRRSCRLRSSGATIDNCVLRAQQRKARLYGDASPSSSCTDGLSTANVADDLGSHSMAVASSLASSLPSGSMKERVMALGFLYAGSPEVVESRLRGL